MQASAVLAFTIPNSIATAITPVIIAGLYVTGVVAESVSDLQGILIKARQNIITSA